MNEYEFDDCIATIIGIDECNNLNDLCKYTDYKNFIWMLSISDEGSSKWDLIRFPDWIREKLPKPGFRSGYSAIIDTSSKMVMCKAESGSLSADICNTHFVVTSQGYSEGKICESTFTIDGETYSSRARGLNVLIYSIDLRGCVRIFSSDLFLNILLKKEFIDKTQYVSKFNSNNICKLYYAEDFNTILNVISNFSIILLSISDEGSSKWDLIRFPDWIREKLPKPGFRSGYSAIIDTSSKMVMCKAESGSLSADICNTHFVVTSQGYSEGKICESTFTIDGETYSSRARGLNVLIYSSNYEDALYLCTVDTFIDSTLSIKRRCVPHNLVKYSVNKIEVAAIYRKILQQRLVLNELLDILMRIPRIVILLSISDEGSSKWDLIRFPDWIREKLPKPGFRSGYSAIIDTSSKMVMCKAESGSLSADICNTHFVVTSQGYSEGKICESTFTIDGETYSSRARGLNLFVYDLGLSIPLTFGAIDTFADCELSYVILQNKSIDVAIITKLIDRSKDVIDYLTYVSSNYEYISEIISYFEASKTQLIQNYLNHPTPFTKAKLKKHAVEYEYSCELSLIIPIYNTERFLKSMFHSVLNQTLDDMEIICVNDCSTDHSLELLEQMSVKNPKLKIISHSINMGTMKTRMDGVKFSNGKYIMFLDSDDELTHDACRIALDAIKSTNADILQFGTTVINDVKQYENGVTWFESFVEPAKSTYYGEDIFLQCFEKRSYRFSIWNKIYRSNICKIAHELLNDNHYCIAEDMYEYFSISLLSNKYCSIQNNIYRYYYGRGVTTAVAEQSMVKHCTQADIVDECKKLLQSAGLYPARYNALCEVEYDLFFECMNYSKCAFDKKQRNEFYNIIYQKWKDKDIRYTVAAETSHYYVKDTKEILEGTIPVVFCVNDSYAPMLYATLNSIIHNINSSCKYEFYVLHEYMNDKNIKKLSSLMKSNTTIHFKNIHEYIVADSDILIPVAHYGVETYYRFYIPDVINYSKVLYLDADIIVKSDIAQLYSYDLKHNILGGVLDLTFDDGRDRIIKKNMDPSEYINCGVLLINVDLMRELRIKECCIDVLRNNDEMIYPDQDALNMICSGRILQIPLTWNFIWHTLWINKNNVEFNNYKKVMENSIFEANIIHYCGDIKPWNSNRKRVNHILYDEFWKYCTDKDYFAFLKNKVPKKNKIKDFFDAIRNM